MNLEQLTAGMPELVKITGNAQTEIKALTADSRAKCEDGLFFCIRGGRVDAHDFAPQAVAGGCVALVVERELAIDCPQVVVTDVRAAMTRIASAFNGHPERRMKLVGVTGTKGKTTTTYLFKSIVESAGMRCGIIGTTGCIAGQTKLPSHLTTPDPIEMFEILRIMADAGVEVVCMEVSAHALYLRKLVGVVFEAAAYTNLSQDHLDFFGTMDNYLAAKKLLFSAGMARNAAVNVDEETAKAVCDSLDCPLLTYGISGKADLFARDIEITETGVSFTLNLRNLHAERVHLLLTGMFNVYNALAAAACALILGVELDAIKRGLEAVVSVPGRVEMLPTKTPYRMILDYSHSPDALENILKTVREFCHGRIILVFGCGGDRDKGKRPMMGEIAGRLADYAILTSDNPRFEDPMAILAAIEAGIKPTGAKYEVIENRREAIRQAMEMAVSGDIVVLAGKGHETYQEIRGVKHPFDEKVIVSHTGALKFTEAPKSLGVIGAGVIGLELGSVWSRLGTEVTLFDVARDILPSTDAVMRRTVKGELKKQGLVFHMGVRVEAVEKTTEGVKVSTVDKNGTRNEYVFEKLLVAAGRTSLAPNLAPESVGLKLDTRGYVEVDACGRTNLPGVWAAGDVAAGSIQLAHYAHEQGVNVARSIASGRPVRYESPVPAVVYIAPEVAWVGETEEAARSRGIAVRTGVCPFAANVRAKAQAQTTGFVKVVCEAATDRILGVHIVGEGAADLCAEAAAAMAFGATAEDLGLVMHPHPSLSEALAMAALASRREATDL